MDSKYLDYHRRPNVKPLSIREFNVKFGTSMEENDVLEASFMARLKQLKRQMGPNEYIHAAFFPSEPVNTCDTCDKPKQKKKSLGNVLDELNEEYEEEGWLGDQMEKLKKKGEKMYKEGKKKGEKLYKKGKVKVTELKKKSKNKVEEEYDDYNVEDELDSLLLNEVGSGAFEETKKHIVLFQKGDITPARLMKGKDRYLKSLRNYLNGDESAEIRMLDNSKVKVASLNPDMESLEKMLEKPPGTFRVCECI
jgi:hypothetical protein